MTRRPPRSTRTDTRVPYTTLVRSRRRVEDREVEALLPQYLKIGSEARNGSLRKGGIFRLPLIPPISERSLRINVDQNDGTRARILRLDGEMPDKGGLAGPPFFDAKARARPVFPSNSGFREWVSMIGHKIWLKHSPVQICGTAFTIS